MNESTPQTWPDLAVALYDRLTGRGAEITYEAQGLEIHVPDRVGPDATHTLWKVSGSLKIRTSDGAE
ncbi:hypothetical protein [Haloferula rosea]|uniref:Uncharacterized protein n=1 Tax=Haloferula rosea TaxID=490093 RepID=A0A934R9J8_9BACT|nr:hypothetical protein [Haloferula rosea]MBK1826882.1 hypothetical protein [Haloferula rosea]